MGPRVIAKDHAQGQEVRITLTLVCELTPMSPGILAPFLTHGKPLSHWHYSCLCPVPPKTYPEYRSQS